MPPTVRTSSREPSRKARTRAAVRVSCQASSGCRWRSRRRLTRSSPRAATSGEMRSMSRSLQSLCSDARSRSRCWPWLAAAVALALSVAPVHCGREVSVPRGGSRPRPALHRPRGPRGRASSSFRGKVVVLNVWATWCAPCLAELPSLDRLHRALSRDGLVVAGRFGRREGRPTWPPSRSSAASPSRCSAIPAVRSWPAPSMSTSYPTTFVIDAGGRLRERYLGPADWDLPEAARSLPRPLSESTAPTR